MGQERRHFTDEFKLEAIALLASSGRPLLQIASELGISPSMLRNWRNRSTGRHSGSAPHPQPASAASSVPDPAAEISRLRRENDRLRMERDILKNSSRDFLPPVAVETGGVSLAAERKRPSALWWR
jgi:transposase